MVTAKQCLDGEVVHGQWPETMEDFYALCTEDDLVNILLKKTYVNPMAYYPGTVGTHIRAILRSCEP
jgi:hypothetical protein